MGTNYYHRTDICESCNRFDERHIGKSSGGWQFSFQGYDDIQPNILSFEDWKRELQEGKIFTEYGEEISFENFVELVESKHKPFNKNHYDYCVAEHKARGYDMSRDWKDGEGYSFTFSEFS
jgi:hypothetical protein